MAQLSDDCFAHGGALMRVDEALALLGQRIETLAGVEDIPLTGALSRILAEDVTAPRDVPPHNNSAVDGYAVYFDDLDPKDETRLPIAGRAAAGHPLGRDARRGEAVRIFTGAPMPGGAAGGPDVVMMQEDCREDDDAVVISPGIKRGANWRKAGEDIEAGSTILHSGHRLRPQDVGLAASVGRAALTVFKPLRAALFSTGDEIRDPGDDAPPGCVYDANRYTLMGLLAELGCVTTDLGIVPDRFEDVQDILAGSAADHDLIITSGGMSVGEEDHVKAAVEALGALHFWRLAIKPGRPIALGTVDGTPFIGLPGNPVAVMVTFIRIARPMILRLAGATDLLPTLYQVRADFDHRKKKDRREWVRANLTVDGDGTLVAHKFPRQGAGILSSMVQADGLVELPEHMTVLKRGSMVDFLPFSEVR